ncbi:unnamed protein product [Spirodela intermedia]|uniref:Uncharacterized protein n=1 Tax=Spirodela intermedia TaxID=51605 RepID=A0A7I8KRM8_SPIIN|nr:unnamed protein product [Spirodela intermedia]
MANAVLGYAVERVGDLLIDEAVFLYSVKDQVEWVKEELQAMECFLKDADAKSKGDERVQNWVRQVREIAYRAEDLVESFILDADRRRRRRKCFIRTIVPCCIPPPYDFIILHQFGEEIEALRAKIREINERRSTYGIKDLGEEPGRQIGETVRERRRVVLHASDSDLVGMDAEKNKILGHLLDGSRKKRSVISIVGMGGLGKTTLAKRVFNEARADFGHSVWIDVSQQYSTEDLLGDILRQVTKLGEEELEKMKRPRRQKMLYQTLQAEKYLIAMDDVWDKEVWRILSPHLPDVQNGSRVLITTRSVDVARAAGTSTPHYELRFLTEEESWELLSKKAFPNQGDIEAVCTEPLRNVGKQIARKCGGLPLALVVLGGLLSTKGPSIRAWRRLAETLVWENIEEGRMCLDILALSFDDLPRHLKCCFLYFSSLPEDFKIGIDRLIGLWIAEGFVKKRSGETLEEIAEGYLQDLVQRCMVIVVRDVYVDPWVIRMPEFVLRCRIHDLLHDFTIAEAKELGFLVCDGIRDDGGASQLDSSARRLSLHGDKAWCWDSESTPRLRTLLSFGTYRNFDINRTFPITDLKLLRVVDLEWASIDELPKQVGDLIHLRYLGLKNTKITSLPSSVGQLRRLQCLDVEGTGIKTMPKGVWKIETLRKVLVPFTVEPEMVDGGLRSLQVLKLVRAGRWIDSCLGSLTSLRELQITGIEGCHHSALLSWLPKLPRLKKLLLQGASIPDCLWRPSGFSSLQVLSLIGTVTRPPQHSSSGGDQWLPSLTELILSYTSLCQDSIAALEKLPELTYLFLGHGSYVGKQMLCSGGGFPQLESLIIDSLHKLERWVIEAGAMPRLRSLKIYDCTKLEMLPEGLRRMAALKDLTLLNMSPDICSRAEKEGEDWPKIQHIPSITISAINPYLL